MRKAVFFIGIGFVLVVIAVVVLGLRSQPRQVDEASPTVQKTRTPEQRIFTHDQDRDGISDEQEAALGTSDTEFDTDGDTIPDDLEVNKYGTDPLNPDSDGDGFWDGYEILNGYNPQGEGRL